MDKVHISMLAHDHGHQCVFFEKMMECTYYVRIDENAWPPIVDGSSLYSASRNSFGTEVVASFSVPGTLASVSILATKISVVANLHSDHKAPIYYSSCSIQLSKQSCKHLKLCVASRGPLCEEELHYHAGLLRLVKATASKV